jgi:hypothetical protein
MIYIMDYIYIYIYIHNLIFTSITQCVELSPLLQHLITRSTFTFFCYMVVTLIESMRDMHCRLILLQYDNDTIIT